MMAVDTSALMAIVLREAEAEACKARLETETELLISAGTVAEALIVAARRNVEDEMHRLIDGLGFEIVAVTAMAAPRIAAAHRQWGRGRHPAALNYGDCFSYDLARHHACPLLFVGNGFAKTDLISAL